MGQQQLLVIVLALIIVALAIVTGFWLFQDAAADANRQAVIIDLHHLASIARKHYRTPVSLGGGGNTFQNFTVSPHLAENANGTYQQIKPGHDTDHIHFEGIGVEKGNDGINPIRIEIRIEINEIKLTEQN
ncbi:MAG: hypothetical protein ACE5H0_10645 [Bacteroidota bacterium]